MARIQLSGGAYQARSVIASAQRALNIYAETMPQAQGEPSAFAYYPTAGLTVLATLPKQPIRGLYRATNRQLYCVAGDTLYGISQAWQATALGSITSGLITPASMCDNGKTLVVVDGTPQGWQLTLANNTFSAISDPSGQFVGADRVDYLDGYLLFNAPGTPQMYWTMANSVSFEPNALYFGNKSAHSDILQTLAVAKRLVWLIGDSTSEIWYDSGAQDTPLEPMPNVIIDHGTPAKYSVAVLDNSVFWLSRDRAGAGFVMQGSGFQNTRISTYAIEYELTTYPRLSDAVGMTYQYAGHMFYHLSFPSANGNMGKTWLYDVTTQQWAELAWCDTNGQEWRHRANCAAHCYDVNVVGDWQHGTLYRLDPNVYTDDGHPIKRQRVYPHLLNEGKRVFYRQFIADLETGTAGAGLV